MFLPCAPQSFEKVQKSMTEQQQVQVLQQQGHEQGEKLRRVTTQKQRLEGLCRALQVGWRRHCRDFVC